MAADPELTVQTQFGDPVVEEARKRFDVCMEWESTARRNFLADWKFRHGDSNNGHQWPEGIRRSRDVADRPCLTMNIVQQHNLQIVNEAKRNKSSVKLVGTGNGATQDSANVLKNIIRYIERRSNAQSHYTHAREFQVDAGIGYWRIITEYESNETFRQEIAILPVLDPLTVCIDPDCQQRDTSDARYGFIFDTMPNDVFKASFPQFAESVGDTPLGMGTGESFWLEKDHMMVCEYFRKVQNKDRLISFWDAGRRWEIRESRIHPDIKGEVLADPLTKTREIWDDVVEWYLIAGERIVDHTIWPGKYIPIIPCKGIETITEGILDRKGHTRSMLDAQRMYNYNASSQVEFVALQGQTPWIAPVRAIENFEQYWNTANTENHAVLPWNDLDEDNPDKAVQPPFRQEPPNFSPAYQTGMETARTQMMFVSGQYQNELGMVGNERTGAAIGKRQEQSDTATYHFQDQYAEALRYTYVQIVDLICNAQIYDIGAVKKIQADDGEDLEITIDPRAKQAYTQELNYQGQVIRHIFNPDVGKYEVDPSVGPAIGTQREATVEALTMILSENPGLSGIIGDILLSNMDFEQAQEAAMRLKRMVPPQALGQGPTQNEQALQQQIQVLQTELAKTLERLGKESLKLTGKDQMRDIDAYDSETKRIAALAQMLPMDAPGLQTLIHQLVGDALQTHLVPILKANMEGLGEAGEEGGDSTSSVNSTPTPPKPPIPGANQAPDGNWYILDPTRRSKYLRIEPLAQEHKPPTP